MRLSGPPPLIIGRNVVIRGPLGVAVNIDTGTRTPGARPLPAITRTPKVRA